MLIITEKPSVAASFAQALNCSKTNGHYSSTDGSIIITNCIGHLFQLVPPDQYNPAFKKWNMADLPIVPHIFRYEVTAATKLQAQLVVDLIKKNTHNTIIIATDAGREGELIARITLQMAGITDISRCKRFWVSEALTPDVIQQGLQEAKPLADFNALADQAYARQHADWLIGINLSRYMSIGQQTVFLLVGYRRRLLWRYYFGMMLSKISKVHRILCTLHISVIKPATPSLHSCSILPMIIPACSR